MTAQELFHLLPRFIKNKGLKVLTLDSFPPNMIIDSAALMHILQQTSKLTKLCLRHMGGIKPSSLAELIEIVA